MKPTLFAGLALAFLGSLAALANSQIASELFYTDVTAAIFADKISAATPNGRRALESVVTCADTCTLRAHEYQEVVDFDSKETLLVRTTDASSLPIHRAVLPLFADPSLGGNHYVLAYNQFYPGDTDLELVDSLEYIATVREMMREAVPHPEVESNE